MDFSALGLALAAPAIDLIGELGLGGNTPLQALAGEGGEVEFNLVEPGAALGGVVDLKTVGQALGQGRGQAVIKRTQGVGVQVVLHQPDFGGLRVAGGQLLPKLGVLALGTPRPHLIQVLAGERLDGGEYTATAVLGVGVVRFGWFARLRGQPLDHLAEQKARPLIEADDRKPGVMGLGVEREQRFEALQVLPVDLSDAPRPFQVGP